ncbi:hypothetical protein [Thermofilum sp.]|jgi:hypothetical protein|uniref:hypothetical protein n=1 Tax=Thermofilum sp. TaxID=1961369 RepID=UPI00258D794A|nr:hypothetical protein [Thermofilum sp.]
MVGEKRGGSSSVTGVIYFALSLFVWALMILVFGGLGFLMFILYIVLIIVLARPRPGRGAEKRPGDDVGDVDSQ